jgi:glycolate oxidase
MTNTLVVKKFEKLLGKDNVLSEKEDCYPYAFDVVEQGLDVKIPDIVVLPETKEQVQEIVKFASKEGIPIVARGAGTNQAGSCIPVQNGIVMHFPR